MQYDVNKFFSSDNQAYGNEKHKQHQNIKLYWLVTMEGTETVHDCVRTIRDGCEDAGFIVGEWSWNGHAQGPAVIVTAKRGDFRL